MKKLLVDAGNSGIKWTILECQSLSKMQRISYKDDEPFQILKSLIKKYSNLDGIVIASVLGQAFNKKVKELTSQYATPELYLIHSTAQLGGVSVAYDDPLKLGIDRLLAMIAVHDLSEKNEMSIVVDSGTATTIDAIDASGQHLGGVILPGLELCNQSLVKGTELLEVRGYEEKTAELPKINPFAKNTQQAIASGSLLGLAGAIDNICTVMEKNTQTMSNTDKKASIKIYLCGGAIETLLPYLQGNYFVEEDLVLQGIKVIEMDSKA